MWRVRRNPCNQGRDKGLIRTTRWSPLKLNNKGDGRHEEATYRSPERGSREVEKRRYSGSIIPEEILGDILMCGDCVG